MYSVRDVSILDDALQLFEALRPLAHKLTQKVLKTSWETEQLGVTLRQPPFKNHPTKDLTKHDCIRGSENY